MTRFGCPRWWSKLALSWGYNELFHHAQGGNPTVLGAMLNSILGGLECSLAVLRGTRNLVCLLNGISILLSWDHSLTKTCTQTLSLHAYHGLWFQKDRTNILLLWGFVLITAPVEQRLQVNVSMVPLRPVNPLIAELSFLGRSLYFRMTLTYRISGPVGFSDSKMHTLSKRPSIACIFAVIRESNHTHFLKIFCSDNVNVLWHKRQPWTCNLEVSLMLKTRHVALSDPSGCAPQAAQCLTGAIFTLGWPHPPPCVPPFLLSQSLSPGESSPGSDIISNSHDANWRL